MVERCSLEMIGNPQVTVLMTVYNGAPYLAEAVESIIDQTFLDWELIVVDNCSTDESLSILRGYEYDPRIKVVSFSKNMGRVYALKHAFSLSSGEFLAILDADDLARNDRLNTQVEFLKNNPNISLVASWSRLINSAGEVIGELRPPIQPSLLHKTLGWANVITHSSVMYRKNVAVKFGGYSEHFIWGHDFSFILSMAQISNIGMIGDFLCDLRIIKSSMTRSAEFRMIVASENLELFKKASVSLKLDGDGIKRNKTAISVAEVKYGIALMQSDSIFKGLTMVLISILFDPSILWKNGPVRRFFGASF